MPAAPEPRAGDVDAGGRARPQRAAARDLGDDAPDREALIETLDDVSGQIADGEIEIPRE